MPKDQDMQDRGSKNSASTNLKWYEHAAVTYCYSKLGSFPHFLIFSVDPLLAVIFVYKQTRLFVYKLNYDIRGFTVTISCLKLNV